ncbi:MAG: DUF4276 family protein [Balneola sp.]
MSIKKFAYFVEGYTEQQFIINYIANFFTNKDLAYDIESVQGGSKVAISYTTISSSPTDELTKYYFLIYNCNGDNKIKSYILDRRESLLNSGYEKIIGLRDVYPDVEKADIQKLHNGLNYKMPQADLPTKFILSIMEIEAWFLSEEKHFLNIDKSLTVETIKKEIGFDPLKDNSEDIEKASETLRSIYSICGKSYRKKTTHIDRTINALDIENLYLNSKKRNSSLKELLDEIDKVFD